MLVLGSASRKSHQHSWIWSSAASAAALYCWGAPLAAALFLALALTRAVSAGGSSAQILKVGLLLFAVYSSFNLASLQSPRLAQWHRPAEIQSLELALSKTPALSIVLSGGPKEARHQMRLKALAGKPWRSGGGDLRLVNDPKKLANDHLYPTTGPFMVFDWRRQNPFAVGRPKDQILVLILGSKGLQPHAPLNLVAPTHRSSWSLRQPEALSEDLSFVFELDANTTLEEDEAFCFFGHYDGPDGPRGKRRLAPKLLPRSVLERVKGSTQPSDATRAEPQRWQWRMSVRPGPGQSGIYPEDPELGLAGKALWWSVGLVKLQDQDHGHDRDAGHEGQAHRLLQPRFLNASAPITLSRGLEAS